VNQGLGPSVLRFGSVSCSSDHQRYCCCREHRAQFVSGRASRISWLGSRDLNYGYWEFWLALPPTSTCRWTLCKNGDLHARLEDAGCFGNHGGRVHVVALLANAIRRTCDLGIRGIVLGTFNRPGVGYHLWRVSPDADRRAGDCPRVGKEETR
jgi:hypothetical protein